MDQPPQLFRHLPVQQTSGSYRIAVVCLGNICRSPMADVVLNSLLNKAGLASRVTVESSGTGGWHVGNPMDNRAAATLTAAGYDATRHRAQQFTHDWLAAYDLILAMDENNLAEIRSAEASPESDRVQLFRDFDPVGDTGREVPDPYYGGDSGFQEVLAMVERTSAAIVAACQRELATR